MEKVFKKNETLICMLWIILYVIIISHLFSEREP